MVPFAVPVTLTARLLQADLDQARVQARLEKWTAAWVTAACLGLFFLAALHLAGPVPSLLTTALLASGSVLFSTVGQGLWQHGGIIFWSLAALLVEFHTARRPRLRGTLAQGVACGMTLACRLSAALFVVPFTVWVLIRSPRRGLALAACTAVAFAPWAAVYASLYGTPFGPSSGQMEEGLWSWKVAGPLAGLLVSPGRGLLVYQPWLLLAVFAFLPLARRQQSDDQPTPAGWPAFCLSVIILQLVLVAAWHCWWGGHCYGSRLAAEIVPLGALLCVRPVALLWQARAGRPVIISVAVLSFLIHAGAVYQRAADWDNWVDVDYHPRHLWSWSHPPFLYPWQHRDKSPGHHPKAKHAALSSSLPTR